MRAEAATDSSLPRLNYLRLPTPQSGQRSGSFFVMILLSEVAAKG